MSIHGIPMGITEEELEVWVDKWADRTTNVQRAKAKKSDNPRDKDFDHMMNGHRFCYISKIKYSEKPIDRYSTYSRPDPENPRNLTTIKITTYLEGHAINCRKCWNISIPCRTSTQ